MSFVRLGIISLVAVMLTSVGHAEEIFVSQSPNILVEIAMPGFHDDRGSIESRQSGTTEQGNSIVIDELIPGDETFDSWRELFAVMIEEDLGWEMQQYVGSIASVYLNECSISADDIIVAELSVLMALFFVPCPSYKSDQSTGEFAVFYVQKMDEHFVKIYQHWRGPAFDLADTSTWPGSQETLERFILGVTSSDISRLE